MSTRNIAAIEAGGTKFVLAIAAEEGDILEQARIDTRGGAETLAEAADWFRAAQSRHGPIAVFGVASFGPIVVDPRLPDYGTFTTTPKPGWSGVRFQDALAEFHAPVVVDTDVNGAALGEWLAGAGQGCDTLAYTTVGTGIGAGVLHKGASRGGISHLEAGHIRPPRDAARDPYEGHCPYHGDCLEGLASGPAIRARWGESLDTLAASDPDAVRLIASYLADFAASLVLLHMPDRLIFGGGVVKAPGLIDELRRQTEERLGGYIQHPRLTPGLTDYIVAPGLGDAAGITGAIALGKRGL